VIACMRVARQVLATQNRLTDATQRCVSAAVCPANPMPNDLRSGVRLRWGQPQRHHPHLRQRSLQCGLPSEMTSVIRRPCAASLWPLDAVLAIARACSRFSDEAASVWRWHLPVLFHNAANPIAHTSLICLTGVLGHLLACKSARFSP